MAQLKTLSKAQLVKKVESNMITARKARDKTAKAVENLTATGVSAASAFGVSFLDQKYGGNAGYDVGGFIPMSLLVAGGALGLGMSGMGGNASHHLLAIGNGALMAWASHQGRAAGATQS